MADPDPLIAYVADTRRRVKKLQAHARAVARDLGELEQVLRDAQPQEAQRNDTDSTPEHHRHLGHVPAAA